MATLTDAEAMGLGPAPIETPAIQAVLKDSYISNNQSGANDTMQSLRRMPIDSIVVDRIYVAGEPVQLNEDGFVESRGGNIVSFKNRYFPDADSNMHADARIIFSMIFNHPEGILLPPKDEYQLQVFINGLVTRRKTLYSEMKDEISLRKDSATLRAKMEIYTAIDNLIKTLSAHIENGNHHDYTPSGKEKGIVSVDIGLKKNMDNLLRQFAFLALQAKMEVPKYADSTESAHQMVELLSLNPITQKEMTSYIKLWREQANVLGDEIPFGIAEILDSVSGQTGLIDTLISKQLTSFYTELVSSIKKEYSVNKVLSEAFNAYIKQLEYTTSDTKRRIRELLIWIVEFNKNSWDNLGNAQTKEKIARDEYTAALKSLNNLKKELDKAHTNYADLESKYKSKIDEHAKGAHKLENLEAEYENYKKAHSHLVAVAKSHVTAKENTAAYREKISALQEEVKQLEAIAAAAKSANSSANVVIGGYKNEIANLKKENARLQKMLPTLTAGVQKVFQEHTKTQQKLATSQTEVVRLKQSLQDMQGRIGIQSASPLVQRGGAATVDEEQVEVLTKQLAVAEESYQQQLAAMTETLAQLQEALDQHSACQEKLKDSQVKLETTVRTSDKKEEQKVSDVKTMEVQIKTLAQNLDEAKQQLGAKEDSLDAAQDTIRVLQATLNDFSEMDPKKVESAIMKQKLDETNKTLNDLLLNMQSMGNNIISNQEYVIPEGIAPKAGSAFKKLYEIVKTRLGVTNPGKNVACFLNYFVTFFLKLIFFSNPDKRHVAVLEFYRLMMREVVADVKTKIPSATKKENIYTIMEFLFSLIHDCEIVKLTAEDVGLHVLMTRPDSNPVAILESMHKVFSSQKDDVLEKSITFLKNGIFKSSSIALPDVHFNMPLNITTKGDEHLNTLSIFPNFTYIPQGYEPNDKWFDIIDTRNGYARQGVNITDNAIAQKISKTMADNTLDYISIFVMFILLAQEYLVDIEDELKKCS